MWIICYISFSFSSLISGSISNDEIQSECESQDENVENGENRDVIEQIQTNHDLRDKDSISQKDGESQFVDDQIPNEYENPNEDFTSQQDGQSENGDNNHE